MMMAVLSSLSRSTLEAGKKSAIKAQVYWHGNEPTWREQFTQGLVLEDDDVVLNFGVGVRVVNIDLFHLVVGVAAVAGGARHVGRNPAVAVCIGGDAAKSVRCSRNPDADAGGGRQ